MFLLSELVASKFSRGTISQIEPFTVNKVFCCPPLSKEEGEIQNCTCFVCWPVLKAGKPSQMKIKVKKIKGYTQGWARRSFPFRTFRSFPLF